MKKIWTIIRSIVLIISGIFTLINGDETNRFVTYLAIGLLAIGVIDLIVLALGNNKEKKKVEGNIER